MNNTQTNTNTLVIDFEYEDSLKQDNLLTHITNLLMDFGDTPLDVEVVAYGQGIMMLVKSKAEFADRIAELQARGVIFHACWNAMRTFEIEDSQLLENVTPVPSGVGRIVKAQLEGSAYLKA